MNFNVDEVVCDGKKAAEMAMKYLFSLGHQRIAYIGDCSFERRYVGYCDMLIRNDLPMDYELIKQTKGDAEMAFSELLEKRYLVRQILLPFFVLTTILLSMC